MTITIGQRLKIAREDQRLTLEQVFESTRIRVQYLQALEEDDLSVMPSPVQARGYLRNYAEFLGLDVAKLLEDLREDRRCRVLLAHHCPRDGIGRPRRRLLDAAELRGCIARQGADLILHGHEHAFSFGQIAGREGPVPVFGMPSASRLSPREELTAQHCVYEIEAAAGEWRILAERRIFSPASGTFTGGARPVVAQQNGALILSPENDPATCRK